MMSTKGTVELFRTRDGSPSLYHRGLEESYHSTHGAIQESRHVFIEKGLFHPSLQERPSLHILEVGLGTGINAWLCSLEAEGRYQELHYESLEPEPVEKELLEQVGAMLPVQERIENFRAIHRAPWEEWSRIAPYFQLWKRKLKLEDLKEGDEVNLILYDAFGSRAQPEMWDSPVLDRALDRAAPGCIFVTYGANGSLKRSIKKRDWKVEVLQGPPGKREMVRAERSV